jgi:hypothetical protein
VVSASNTIDYAYRATDGSDGTALVCLQPFRGNLDNWDPALIDAPAGDRPVITAALCSCGSTANAPYCDGSGTCTDWPHPSRPASA